MPWGMMPRLFVQMFHTLGVFKCECWKEVFVVTSPQDGFQSSKPPGIHVLVQPHNESELTHETTRGHDCMWLPMLGHKIAALALHTWTVFSGGNQLPCHEDAQEALLWSPYGEELRLLAKCQQKLASLGISSHSHPSDDCSTAYIWLQLHKRLKAKYTQ